MISNKKIIYLFIMLFISNSNTLFIKLTNAVSSALLLLLNNVKKILKKKDVVHRFSSVFLRRA